MFDKSPKRVKAAFRFNFQINVFFPLNACLTVEIVLFLCRMILPRLFIRILLELSATELMGSYLCLLGMTKLWRYGQLRVGNVLVLCKWLEPLRISSSYFEDFFSSARISLWENFFNYCNQQVLWEESKRSCYKQWWSACLFCW